MTASQMQPAESQGHRQQSDRPSQSTMTQQTGSQQSSPQGVQQTGGQGIQQGQGVQQPAAQGTQRPGAQQPLVGQLYPTTNHLPQDVRTTSIAVLNQVLIDATVLQRQIETAHWNVKGLHFLQLHELFEEVAEAIEAHVDTIAERATALGGQAIATVPIAAQHTTLPPLPAEMADGQVLLDEIAQRLSLFDTCLYRNMEAAEQAGDLDTVDLLNEVSRDVSKALWMVESHLHQPTAAGGMGPQQRR